MAPGIVGTESMPYRKFAFQKGNYYHLYNRGVNHERIFFDRENYIFFLRRLRDTLSRGGVDLVAYCLMPNHDHFLVCLQIDDLGSVMQPFLLSYTKAINKRYERVGSLFQGRYCAIHVDREEYLLHLSRYVHLNPVRAGLVGRPEDWEFSSYPEFVGLRKGTLPRPQVIISQFPSSEAYRAFVEAGAGAEETRIRHLLFD